jgi:hypothetical protein
VVVADIEGARQSAALNRADTVTQFGNDFFDLAGVASGIRCRVTPSAVLTVNLFTLLIGLGMFPLSRNRLTIIRYWRPFTR